MLHPKTRFHKYGHNVKTNVQTTLHGQTLKQYKQYDMDRHSNSTKQYSIFTTDFFVNYYSVLIGLFVPGIVSVRHSLFYSFKLMMRG